VVTDDKRKITSRLNLQKATEARKLKKEMTMAKSKPLQLKETSNPVEKNFKKLEMPITPLTGKDIQQMELEPDSESEDSALSFQDDISKYKEKSPEIKNEFNKRERNTESKKGKKQKHPRLDVVTSGSKDQPKDKNAILDAFLRYAFDPKLYIPLLILIITKSSRFVFNRLQNQSPEAPAEVLQQKPKEPEKQVEPNQFNTVYDQMFKR
jgi:hypothetical protein